jgi:murein DD-endopeptidase MepM/ murein hydrolase activator NlpD
VAAAVALAVLVGPLARPAAPEPGAYLPPVDRPLVDRFRPPPSAYGAGNRGVDYATVAGDEVRAAAAGEVTFAGRVGLGLHVVVLHPDGIRTSYSFLAEVGVRRGDAVAQGDVVGRAGASLHWGARVGDRYVDPLGLLGSAGPPEVHLVPTELRSAGTEAEERAALVAGLGLGRGAAAIWSAGRRAVAHGV